MEWVKLDTSMKRFRDIEYILKTQDHYTDRFIHFLIFKKILSTFNSTLYTSGLEKLKYHEGKRVLLVSNHRNVLDAIMIQNIISLAGFKHPRVIAEAALAQTPLRKLLVNNGCIFIRKHFNDLEYRDKMNNELRSYVDQGDWISFYSEGLISKSGKQLLPKRGMLKAFTEDKPCVIYPINISYERVILDSNYTNMLHGVKEFKFINHLYELLSSTIKSAYMGKINVSIGNPIYTSPGEDTQLLSNKITANIMNQNVIYGTDLFSTLVLSRNKDYVNASVLEKEMEWLSDALTNRGFTVFEASLKEVSRLLKHIFYISNNLVHIKDTSVLHYYRNRMMYTLKDLINTSDLLKYESFIDKHRQPRPSDMQKLRELAISCFEPVEFLYKNIENQIKNGETDVANIKQLLQDNPSYCDDMIPKCLEILKEKKIISVEGNTIKLLKR